MKEFPCPYFTPKRRKGGLGSMLLAFFLLWVGSSAWAYTIYSVYTLGSGSDTLINQTYSTAENDTCAIYVKDGAGLTLTNPTITTSGNTSSTDDSSFYGLNAAVLAENGGVIEMSGGTIVTSGSGANGIFATGKGSKITVSDVTIYCTGGNAHGLDATVTGTLIVNNVTATTTSNNGSVIATDRGSGTILVTGGTYTAGGRDSAGIYSTGIINVTSAHVYSTGGEAVVVEGGNSSTLVDTDISGVAGTRDRGIMIYNSQSGDAEEGKGYFTMTRGSYTWPSSTGPAFYVTNQTAYITLNDVTIDSQAEKLIYAAIGDWGTSGKNGGTVIFTANNEEISGDMIADSISAISASLNENTKYTGATRRVAMTIDETSSWDIDGDSELSDLDNSGEIRFVSSGLTLSDSGDFITDSTGKVVVLLGSTSSFNTIAVAGNAELSGTLAIHLDDGFVPTIGQTFTIMTYGSETGSFDTLQSNLSGLEYSVEYGSTSAVITITAVPTTIPAWFRID